MDTEVGLSKAGYGSHGGIFLDGALTWEQDVGGSIPLAPTKKIKHLAEPG